jgi:hypothetical protein
MNYNCENYKDLIIDSLNGQLPDDINEQLQNHKKNCSSCAEYETSLRNEDRLLGNLFEGFEQDLDRQQQEVIKAIEHLHPSKAEKIIGAITDFINKPVVKLSLAAAVIAIAAIDYIRIMGWLYDLEKFMDMCTITVK